MNHQTSQVHTTDRRHKKWFLIMNHGMLYSASKALHSEFIFVLSFPRCFMPLKTATKHKVKRAVRGLKTQQTVHAHILGSTDISYGILLICLVYNAHTLEQLTHSKRAKERHDLGRTCGSICDSDRDARNVNC